MERSSLEKTCRLLRKQIRSLPDVPSVRQIHRLRTRAQKISFVAAALLPVPQDSPLLPALQAVHKAAGRLRNLDVIYALARTLSAESAGHSLERLLRGICKHRGRAARRLQATLARYRQPACQALKSFQDALQSVPHAPLSGALATDTPALRRAIRTQIRTLTHWPQLGEDNLHPFRLEAKRLGTLLKQQSTSDRRLIALLNRTRRSIGEWHDWTHLAAAARKILPAAKAQPLCAPIDRTVLRKLALAKKAALALQEFLAGDVPVARSSAAATPRPSRRAA